ncbi:DUF5507 domain-containing protein [Escherichia coli]
MKLKLENNENVFSETKKLSNIKIMPISFLNRC